MANFLLGLLLAGVIFLAGVVGSYKDKVDALQAAPTAAVVECAEAETVFKDDSVSEEEKQFIVEHPTAVRTVVYEHGKVVESTVHEPNTAEDRSEVPGREPAR